MAISAYVTIITPGCGSIYQYYTLAIQLYHFCENMHRYAVRNTGTIKCVNGELEDNL